MTYHCIPKLPSLYDTSSVLPNNRSLLIPSQASQIFPWRVGFVPLCPNYEAANNMHRTKISVLLSFLVLPAACKFTNGVAEPSISGELYNEDLLMRPLHDGRVVATFTFTTVLLGATPRDPRDSERSGGCLVMSGSKIPVMCFC